LDPDVEVVLRHYKHFFPEFSLAHALVYKCLWRVHPMQVEDIIKETQLSNATVYRTINYLTSKDLVKRTNFKPVSYYANDPIRNSNTHLKKLVNGIEKEFKELQQLLENSTGLSGELYLVKRDGGQQKLLIKQTREELNEIEQLLLIKKTAEEQLKQLEKQKLKQLIVYK
jgi:sugar-specific transcriptional regulator TrmB